MGKAEFLHVMLEGRLIFMW